MERAFGSIRDLTFPGIYVLPFHAKVYPAYLCSIQALILSSAGGWDPSKAVESLLQDYQCVLANALICLQLC